jgi:hypothetical protein
MDGIIAYILSKKYTNDTVIGMGAIKGAACQVQSINKVGKTTTVTLKWEDNTGGIHTQPFEIEDGADGISVSNATINASGNLILTLSDGNTIDCGKVLPQYDTMPTPSSSNEGQILQYIGTTTSDYTNGYFYECINDSGVYKWVEKLVQDSYTKSEIGNLNDLPDDTKNIVQNIGDLKLSIDQLSASKLSKTDIDNVLSTTSENPVQNKVVTDALNDKENKFRVTLIPIASASDVGKIIQYIGSNTSSLTSGYYYQCVEVSTGVYDWVQKNVQPSNGGTGGDGVVDGYYNSTDQLFYEDIAHTNPISGDSNTLYVSVDTNLVYRFNGTIFIRVDEVVGEDDVINGYYNTTDGKFYEDSAYTIEITGETGKIYISIDTNIQYRWDNISIPNKFVPITATIDVDDNFSTTSTNPIQNKVITAKINDIDVLMASKVDKEIGKGLSTNDYTDEDKQKVVDLAPIYLIGSGLTLDTTVGSPTYGKLQATGMSIPIDDELSETSINPVQNKVIALKIDQLQGSVLDKIRKRLSAQEDNFAVWNNDGEIEDSGISKDIIPTTASASNKVLVKSDVDNALSTTSENPVQNKEITVPLQALQGSMSNVKLNITDLQGSVLGIKSDITNLQNDKQDKLIEGNGIDIDSSNKISLDISYLTASRVGYISNAEKGSNNGVAELDATGKVPSAQLPSYVDDIIEGYKNGANFYKDSTHIQLITPESDKIYVDLATNTTWRWSGSIYVQINEGLALGETSSTAYRGDRGKIAYDHSQITNGSNPHNTTADNVNLKVPIPALSGSKLDVESTLYGINTELGKKADKVTSATNGDLAGLDTNGNLTDSGILASNVIVKSATAGLIKNNGTIDTNSYATTTQLANKTDKVVSATNGNLAGLNSSGNLTDSGVVASNVIQKVATATGLLKNDGTVDTTSYATASNLSSHISNTSNPHNVTKSQVGLGSVVNTGDSATPVSGGTTKFTTGGAYTELNKKYDINDTAETSLVDGDYIPFYDTSATAKRKTLWSNIKSVLKTYFDTIYSTVRSRQTPASGGTTLSLVNTGDMYSWNNKGHTMLPASGSAESTIVSTINGATNTNTNVSSLYSIQKWTNEKRIRKVITGTTPIGSASIGSTGIGKWDDSASPDESTWWYDVAFKIPNNRNDIDLSLKFDPSSGEPVTLGGYILDTTTGRLCIKFGNSIATPANAKIAVDITYTRNEFS